ncbi:MAG: PucR family transcriptional regulator [Eubacteriales bacterium]|nr:PucR family transcriptional regulator [Eubacteriales bacterium]
MYISLKEILKNNLFNNVEILAGEEGLFRKVKRVSVFDCPFRDNILDDKIVEEGDFFISCLEQFRSKKEDVEKFINTLIKGNCSGLFIVSDDCIDVINQEVLKKCKESDFPVLLTKEDIPYAHIMDAINKYITIDNLNAINALKLDKIIYGSESNNERMEILYSINPNIEQYVRVICVDGEISSLITQTELDTMYLNKKQDIMVRGNNNIIFILSESEIKKLKYHSDATSSKISDFIDNAVLGFSRIYNRKDIRKALEEGRRALETAKTMKITKQTYEPLSVLQLLVSIKDCQEAHDFYKAYVNSIREKVSAENLSEILLTMETFVANSGNYQETASIMNQHENTIRYRINKVKSALDMENDNVKFYETLAIAVKLRILIGEEI